MTKHFPKPPFKAQPQPIPGRSDKMDPQPDYGEATYRGSNRLKDKKTVITGAMPDGPPVWICGDCHVGNLGPVASAEGELAIQVRDLDQTVIGNPAHDLIRLVLSLAMVARGSDLPGVTTAHMLERMIEGYQSAFRPEAHGKTTDASDEMPKIVAP